MGRWAEGVTSLGFLGHLCDSPLRRSSEVSTRVGPVWVTSEPFMLLLLQVGTRSQSERIRSYNFSQDRVTDHRTGYVTRDIKEFMRGGEPLDDLISELLEHGDKEALLELVVTCIHRY